MAERHPLTSLQMLICIWAGRTGGKPFLSSSAARSLNKKGVKECPVGCLNSLQPLQSLQRFWIGMAGDQGGLYYQVPTPHGRGKATGRSGAEQALNPGADFLLPSAWPQASP